jgi:citrate lyase beta subunit
MGEEVGLAARIGAIVYAVPALSTVVIGIKDLAADLHIPLDPDAADLREGANALRMAAQAEGLSVIDGMAFGDEPVLTRRCARAIAEGFDGITFGRLRDCVAAQASSGQAATSLHSTPEQEQDHGEYRLD